MSYIKVNQYNGLNFMGFIKERERENKSAPYWCTTSNSYIQKMTRVNPAYLTLKLLASMAVSQQAVCLSQSLLVVQCL